MTVAFHRSYPVQSDGRSKRITRLHILREEPTAPRARASIGLRWPQGECGTSAGPHTESVPVYIDPMPTEPPAGLSWCPACIGKLAERRGALARVAAELAGGAA